MDQPAFVAAVEGLGLSLSPTQLEAFLVYEEKLYGVNQVKNLTRVPREEAWFRHFLDSLLFQDLIPQGASVVDLGTGPGLPAWPLACARPDLQVTAVDSNRKMIAFLESVPLSNLVTIQARAEALSAREKFDVVTGRAVAPLPVQLEISAPLCRVDGIVLPMRTAKDPAMAIKSLIQLGLRLKAVHRRTLPIAEAERAFPEYVKVQPTPYKYPRAWAEIQRKPLDTEGGRL